jgi:hypothetical protein
MVRKWCRDDAIIHMDDVKWFVSWRVYDCPYFFLGVEKEWYGVIDGTIVFFFWHCPINTLPELVCVEFESNEGIRVILRHLEKDRPSKIYYRGELPPELSKILTPT